MTLWSSEEPYARHPCYGFEKVCSVWHFWCLGWNQTLLHNTYCNCFIGCNMLWPDDSSIHEMISNQCHYNLRKNAKIEKYSQELKRLDNKTRFILSIIRDESLVLCRHSIHVVRSNEAVQQGSVYPSERALEWSPPGLDLKKQKNVLNS